MEVLIAPLANPVNPTPSRLPLCTHTIIFQNHAVDREKLKPGMTEERIINCFILESQLSSLIYGL